MFKSEIFREYDIRGIFKKDFDSEFAFKLGQAFVTYIKKREGITQPKITLGRDARLSGPELIKQLSLGMQSCGAEVLNLGQITTSVSYFSTFHFPEIMGSIMITASHNPKNYNGFKLSYKNYPFFADKLQQLKAILEEPDLSRNKGSEKSYNIIPEYIKHTTKEFENLENTPVIVDCGNGAAGFVAKQLLKAAGVCLQEILFEEPNGEFPNRKPDTNSPKDLQVLIEKIKKSKKPCIGIALDGDADRLGLIAEDGSFVYADAFMTLFARYVLKENPNSHIVGDVKCSQFFFHEIEKNNGIPIMCKTGHSFIKDMIRAKKAPFGGEFSGHLFFLDKNYGYDDGLYAGLRMLQILANEKVTLKELLETIPKVYSTPEYRIPVESEKRILILKKAFEKLNSKVLQKTHGYSIDLTDGMRITFKCNSWALIRSSNTQSLITVRFESETSKGLNKIQDFIRSQIDLKW